MIQFKVTGDAKMAVLFGLEASFVSMRLPSIQIRGGQRLDPKCCVPKQDL